MVPPDSLESMVVVLSPGRSGSSMLTEILSTSGLKLSATDHLLGAHESNRRGHFEDMRVVSMNTRIMRNHQASWESPWGMRGRRPSLVAKSAVAGLIVDIAIEGVELVKDPRLCSTLPWWWDGWATRFQLLPVVILRNPRQVALSVSARDGLDPILAEMIWLEHVSNLVERLRDTDHLLIFHDELIKSPDDVCQWIDHQLKESVIRDLNPVNWEGVIDPRLHHQRSTGHATLPAVERLWKYLRAIGTSRKALGSVPRSLIVRLPKPTGASSYGNHSRFP